MRIAILGAGNVGGTLGRIWAERGHTIVFGVRAPASDKVRELKAAAGAEAVPTGRATVGADVVLLAVPWGAAEAVLAAAGDLTGKVLLDATNPVAADLSGLSLGQTTSAAETLAELAPGARVVKAFNTTGSANMANPGYGDQAADMFVCGDDADAKAVAGGLAEDAGFGVVDAGPLAAARLLEPLAMLWIRLAYAEGYGPGIAFKLLRR